MRTLLPLTLVLVLIYGCSPVRIVSTDTYSEDFSSYSTYGFYRAETASGEYEDELIAAIEREMNARSFTRADNPDLKINIGTSVTDVTQTRETDYKDIRYVGQRNYQWSSEEVIVNEYKEGTVILDFVDVANDKLVWQGVAASILDGKREKMIARIDEAIEKLFGRFPVK